MPLSYNKMTKVQLLDHAKTIGLKLPSSWNKSRIIESLKNEPPIDRPSASNSNRSDDGYSNPVISFTTNIYIEYSFLCNWMLTSLIIFFSLSFLGVPSFWLWQSENAFHFFGFYQTFLFFVPFTYFFILIPVVAVIAHPIEKGIHGFSI